MNPSRYDPISDPFCYPGASVLINAAGIRDQDRLDNFEAEMVAFRAMQPLPTGSFEVDHYRALHRHYFQDVYAWAGTFRTVRISKSGSMFCYPEHISNAMTALFQPIVAALAAAKGDRPKFIETLAHFLAELNAIHPFREGNGRTQLSFVLLLAAHFGFQFDSERLRPDAFLKAMIASFKGDLSALIHELERLIV